MNRKPYPKYKDSGHPWLGVIPENWDAKRVKEISQLVGRIGFRGYSTDDLVDEGEGAISMSPSNMVDGVVDLSKCTWLSWEKYFESPEIQINPDDVVMVKTGSTIGKTAYVKGVTTPMTINPQLMIFKAIQCNKKFLFYYVSSTVIQDVIPLHNTGSTIPTMTQAGIGKLPFPLPSTEEQTAIADFLDRETGRIDTLVAKKRRLIALLGEKRTALISRTVTRGLPAEAAREFDLEPHTRFKDSGIGWLGEVPEGWEVCALKRITISRCDGPFGSGLKSEHYCDVGVRVIRLQNIRLGQFDNRDSAFIDPEYYRQLGDHTVIPGDVLIAGLGDENNPIGRACVAPCGIGPAMVKADCFRFRLKLTHAIPTYIALQLSISANSLGGALATGTTRGRMNLSTTENRKIALPPLPEQTAIAAYLDRETATIDQLVTKVEAAIVRLLEYRTALITAAVTGKIDVRGKAGLDTD